MKRGIDFGLKSTRLFWGVMMAATAMILFYMFIYVRQPFSTDGNDLATNALTVLAAALSAAAATLIWHTYADSDAPRKVWSRFALGLWLWTAAELVWSIGNMTVGEVDIGLADILWILAYGLLAGSLFQQYDLIACPPAQVRKGVTTWMSVWFSILTLLAGLVMLNFFYPLNFIPLAVNIFYPLGDLLVGLMAFWLARKFRGGLFSRPWIGFLFFAVADLLYAWLEASGIYAWSMENINFLTALTDTLYFSSYLAIAVGAFGHWLALRYSFTEHRQAP